MKKKIISILLTIVMLIGIMPSGGISVFAGDVSEGTGKYIARSWDSTKKQVISTEEDIPATAEEITADTRELTSGWYVLSESVTLPEGAHITVNGNVNLVLFDGCELKIPSPENGYAAIELTDGGAFGSSDSLTIYGQQNGTGSIVAYGGSSAAGIGSDHNDDCGEITVCGGIITATGGYNGAGIGGGSECDCGDIIIYGGKVTATGGNRAAGIGNGSGGNGGSITVYGGKVTAYGNGGGMALGGGSTNFYKNDIYIYGGDILADSKSSNDAVIANSFTVYGDSHNQFSVKDANSTELFAPIAEEKDVYKDLAGNRVLHIELQPVHTFEEYVNNGDGTHSQKCSVCGELGGTPEKHTFENYTCVCGVHNWGKYIDRSWDEETKQVISEEKDIPADAQMLLGCEPELDSGWYVVAGDIEEGTKFIEMTTRLQIHGDVNNPTNIILLDGATLIAPEGISFTSSSDRALNIYGQKNDTGKIIAYGKDGYSAIEGGSHVRGVNGCTITVNGGTVMATAKDNCAGIHVGRFDIGKDNYSTFTVNGGTVTASAEYGAGIGGNRQGNYGIITVNGGTVTATSKVGAGIGGGEGNDFEFKGGEYGSTVTVNGGTVTATSEFGDAGIGGGDGSTDHGTLTIADGLTVKAGDTADTAVTVTAENYIAKRNPYVNIIGAVECAEYHYYDTENKEFKTGYCSDYEVIDKNNIPTTLEKDKWYLVKGTVGLEDALTVPGDAHIILANDAFYTVKYGIAATNGANLTFYAQTDDFDQMGKVEIKNTYSGNAGIGSKRQGECGDITINGGAFYVEGGTDAAGIGAGWGGKCGTVTVNGGKIFTIGGGFGAGIGSGYRDTGESTCAGVVINGGAIIAVGKDDAEHIGAGYGSSAVEKTIATGVYKYEDFRFACINIELFPETIPSCADGHRDYFKNCVSGKYYTTDTLEPDSLIEDIEAWLKGEGFTGKGNGKHKDADVDGYCDSCGTLARANINFYISHGDTPAFTKLCTAGAKLMEQTDEPAVQAVEAKYGTTAGLVNYMYSDGKLVNEYDLVPFGTESMDIYAVLAYDETQPTRTKNGHKAYYENTQDGLFYEDEDCCTFQIGGSDALTEWLSTLVEEGGGMLPATGEPLDTPTADDFDFIQPASCVYDGQSKQATVLTYKDGMGEITVKYQKQNAGGWDSATAEAPTEIGKYRVVISVSEGDNFAASDADITSESWVFEITEGVLTVTYIDENGEKQTAENYIRMASSETVQTYSFEAGKWYVVEGTFTVTSRIENHAPSNNPAHLILGYGAVLNADMGIHNPEGQGLIIYTHSASVPGILVSGLPDEHAAGIGGNNYEAGGDLMICGGSITATGGFLGGAGIGGGYNGNGGNVTINGGTVTANGAGDNGGAGIGGGHGGNGGNVTINGGKVTAKGLCLSAGIGGGYEGGSGGTVTVTGGEVIAQGNSTPGIGGGYNCTDNGKFTIDDGLDMFVGYSEKNCKYQISQLYAYTLDSYVEIKSSPSYTVRHFKQNADKTGYELAETETLTGHTGDKTTASFKWYDGYAPLVFNQQTINKDGSSVVEIYYNKVASAHEHTFSTDWSCNESCHWHDATCEHTDLVSGFGEHTFDENGKCTECKYEKKTSELDEAKAAAKAEIDKLIKDADDDVKETGTTAKTEIDKLTTITAVTEKLAETIDAINGIKTEKAIAAAAKELEELDVISSKAKKIVKSVKPVLAKASSPAEVNAIMTQTLDSIDEAEAKVTDTDRHLVNKLPVEVGNMMGRQTKIGDESTGRLIIPVTLEQLEEIGDKLVIVGGDFEKETTVEIDCAYTYFYDGETKIEAKDITVNENGDKAYAFIIIDCDAGHNPISGYGYYRLYSDTVSNEAFLFDVIYADPAGYDN